MAMKEEVKDELQQQQCPVEEGRTASTAVEAVSYVDVNHPNNGGGETGTPQPRRGGRKCHIGDVEVRQMERRINGGEEKFELVDGHGSCRCNGSEKGGADGGHREA